jgi:2-oxoglutarate dehydrogenase E1 component
MTPKSLLRLPACVSPIDEFVTGRFREVLDDITVDPGRVRRVLLCSGKVYYELAEARKQEKASDLAIVRVEQFYPLHEEMLKQVLVRFGRAKEFVWVQEESQNMGGWSFMEPRLRALGYAVEYVGRDASASPATGSLTVHKLEQKELVDAAIHGPYPHLVRAGRRGEHAVEADGDARRQAVAAAK